MKSKELTHIVMRIFVIIVFFIGLLSCTSKKNPITLNGDPKVDTVLLAKYEKRLTSATGSEKELLKTLIPLIKQFSFRKLDTIIYQKCHLDTAFQEDTLVTHIFERNNSIYLETNWKKDGKLVWSKETKDPYLWINDNRLYQYDTRDKWVTFAIAIRYGLPEIRHISEYVDLQEMAVENGVNELKGKGVEVSNEEYHKYLSNYKGDLVVVGDPESRDGMFVWYAPAKKFILFYHE